MGGGLALRCWAACVHRPSDHSSPGSSPCGLAFLASVHVHVSARQAYVLLAGSFPMLQGQSRAVVMSSQWVCVWPFMAGAASFVLKQARSMLFAQVGRGVVRREGKDVALLAYGTVTNDALKAADMLARSGVSATVVDMR